MHQGLIEYINNKIATKLNDSEIAQIKAVFKPKTLRKHQFFLEEGEVSKYGGFVIKGALKQYTIDESGKENIIGLYVENWWVGDRESQMNNTPTPYYIDAFENTELLVVSKEDFVSQLSQMPFVSELGRVLSEKRNFQLLRRLHATQVMTAEQRLNDLEKTYPEFLQRFPQHIIASYLGMTKETLSRIRANSVRK